MARYYIRFETVCSINEYCSEGMRITLEKILYLLAESKVFLTSPPALFLFLPSFLVLHRNLGTSPSATTRSATSTT